MTQRNRHRLVVLSRFSRLTLYETRLQVDKSGWLVRIYVIAFVLLTDPKHRNKTANDCWI